MKRESQKRRVRERAHGKGLSGGYLEGYEDDEDEEGISLSAIKNKYKGGHGLGKKGKKTMSRAWCKTIVTSLCVNYFSTISLRAI